MKYFIYVIDSKKKKKRKERNLTKDINATMKSDFVNNNVLPNGRAAWNLGKISRMAQRNCAERERVREREREISKRRPHRKC